MCGLIGAFRADDAHWSKIGHFMFQGLYMSALRGMGGTGAGLIFKDYDTEYAKSHTSAINFLNSTEWEWIDKNIFASRAVLGHTRSATAGAVKTVNSHPFRFTDAENEVMMIHNGHVRNWGSLSPINFKHDVDSAHVAISLLNRGAIPTLELIEGAYTLIWYDKKTKTMNLARNEERELFYAQDKSKTHLFFASELDFLSSLLRRNGIEHVDEFFQLDTHTLYSFDLTNKTLVPKKVQYEEKKSPPVVWQGNSSYSGGQQNAGKSFTKPFAACGDYMWVRCGESSDLALCLYKEIGDAEGQTTEKDAYGYIYGTRAMEYGSVIRVNGINYLDWKNGINLIKDALPVKITKVERDIKQKDSDRRYTYYEAVLDADEVDRDVRRARMLKKRDEQAAIRRKEYEAALAAGRALPVPQTSTPVPESGQMGGRDDTVGVGPDDGAPNGKQGVGLDHPIMTYVPGPKGRRITVKEWKEIAMQGCYFCHGKFDLQIDSGKVEFWEHPRNPEDHKEDDAEYQMICVCCMDDPKKMEAIAAA